MPDPVSRLNAALEDRYAIERELGEGGMATVYLADDLKHERKVALDRLVVSQNLGASGANATVGDALERQRFLIVTNFFEELRERVSNCPINAHI